MTIFEKIKKNKSDQNTHQNARFKKKSRGGYAPEPA